MMLDRVLNILLIEDDEDDYILTRTYLSGNEKFEFKLDWEYDYDKAIERVKKNAHDIYLVDYRLGSQSGIDLIKQARSHGCTKPMIMLTGQDNYQTDIESMESGASDYLVKGEINSSLLERAIRYNLEQYNNLLSLREQEVKYRVLFEESLDAVFIANEDLDIIDSNFAFKNLLRTVPENRLQLRDLFKNIEEYESFEKDFNKLGFVVNKEVTLLDSEDNDKTCLVSVNKTEVNGGGRHMIQGIIKDITTLKKAEKELLESEKVILTGKMVRTVAHEIRNPLTNILLALKQLEKKMANEEEGPVNFIGIAEKNTQLINSLIDEMLRASNPGEMKFEPHTLNEVLEEALRLCIDRINLEKIDLVKDLDKKISCRELDMEQLKRAFTNVIINAIEAMKRSKEKVLTVMSRMEHNDCIITITDTGEGIEDDKINDLFEPFYTKKPMGMGLGLTTVLNIMKKHDAEIVVTSRVGEGTTFKFIFPS